MPSEPSILQLGGLLFFTNLFRTDPPMIRCRNPEGHDFILG